MAKKNYVLLYLKNNVFHLLDGFDKFDDIAKVDLVSVDRKNSILWANKELLILGVDYMNKESEYNIKFYNPIYNLDDVLSTKYNLYLQEIILNRVKKVLNKAKDLHLDNSFEFEEFTKEIIDKILNNYALKEYILKNRNVDMKLREYLGRIYNNNDLAYYLTKIQMILTSYPLLRNLMLEYCRYFYKIIECKDINAFDYLYPSELFGYTESFDVSLYDVNKDKNRSLKPVLLPNEEYALQASIYLNRIKKEPFKSDYMQELYNIGKEEAILENMDMDEIYNSGDDNLLKLGLISDEMYLKRHPFKLK